MDKVEMARRIAAHALCGPEKWKPGVKAGMYQDIMDGLADNEAIVLGPLAAIEECTERIEELEAALRDALEALELSEPTPSLSDPLYTKVLTDARATLSKGGQSNDPPR